VAEVAVTVTLAVPGGVPLVGFVTVVLPPPQLTMHNAMVMPARERQRAFAFAFLVVCKLSATTNPNRIAIGHAKVQGRRRANGTAAEVGAVVLMVSEVETGLPLGITLAGENVQLEAAGNPLQPNVTEEAMPFTGFIVIVNVAV